MHTNLILCVPSIPGEGDDLQDKTCKDMGDGRFFSGGILKCSVCHYDTNSCVVACGNSLRESWEVCDFRESFTETCLSEGYSKGGTLKCNEFCKWDYSGCGQECGDGFASPNEACDKDDLKSQTCQSLNLLYQGGDLKCFDDCTLDVSDCILAGTPDCGDGIAEDYEQWLVQEISGDFLRSFAFLLVTVFYHLCPLHLLDSDGEDTRFYTCDSLGLGFTGGTLKCYDDCYFNYEGCTRSSDSSSGNSGCISGDSIVQVLGKGLVLIKDLQVNDKVFDGEKYQPMYSFGHLERDRAMEYLEIHHEIAGEGGLIEVSPDHLVFVTGQEDPIRADQIQVGDSLSVLTAEHEWHASTVTKIHLEVSRTGAYLPLTPEGRILVNGVLLSTYVSIQPKVPNILRIFGVTEQFLFHLWLVPYRMVCLGLSSSLCKNDYDGTNGIAHWLNIGLRFAEFGERQSPPMQWMGVSLVGLFLLFLYGIELVLASRGALLLLLVFLFLTASSSYYVLHTKQAIDEEGQSKPELKITRIDK